NEEMDEVENHFLEEYYEENLALFLTNIEEVLMEENKEKINIEEKI
ncbi:6193_t:CDS:1, partial [Gigaspora margarita]